MSTRSRIGGQVIPGAATEVAGYTVPAGVESVFDTIIVCNQAGATNFTIRIQKTGAALSTAQYLYFQVPIQANQTFSSQIGISMESGDAVLVQSASGNCSFALSVTEVA